jgi:hypothetical protein
MNSGTQKLARDVFIEAIEHLPRFCMIIEEADLRKAGDGSW